MSQRLAAECRLALLRPASVLPGGGLPHSFPCVRPHHICLLHWFVLLPHHPGAVQVRDHSRGLRYTTKDLSNLQSFPSRVGLRPFWIWGTLCVRCVEIGACFTAADEVCRWLGITQDRSSNGGASERTTLAPRHSHCDGHPRARYLWDSRARCLRCICNHCKARISYVKFKHVSNAQTAWGALSHTPAPPGLLEIRNAQLLYPNRSIPLVALEPVQGLLMQELFVANLSPGAPCRSSKATLTLTCWQPFAIDA